MPHTEPLAPEAKHRDWLDDEHEELPPRPRRKLVTRGRLALLGVLVAACGFTGGVLVQKSQQDDAAAGGLPAGIPDLSALGAGAGPGGAAGAGATATAGEVANVKGKTLYVTTADGNTVAVRVTRSATVTRTANSGIRKVRPGDSVVVQGPKKASGAVQATSVSATAAGVSRIADSAPLAAGSQGQGETEPGTDVDSLFER